MYYEMLIQFNSISESELKIDSNRNQLLELSQISPTTTNVLKK